MPIIAADPPQAAGRVTIGQSRKARVGAAVFWTGAAMDVSRTVNGPNDGL
jgi:hypothetical protein